MNNNIFLKKLISFGINAFFIILLLECFLFNYKSYALIGNSDCTRTQLVTENATLDGLEYANGVYKATSNSPSITYSLNQPVRTLCFDINKFEDDGSQLKVDIAYGTESFKNLKHSNKSLQIINGLENTKYTTCSYSGNVQTLKFTIDAETGEEFTIYNLLLNHKIPMDFSLLRCAFLFIMSCLIYTFIKYPTFDKAFNMKARSHKYAIIFTIGAYLLLILFIFNMYVGDYEWTKNATGNQMTQELVDAFENKQVSLIDEVPQELLNLQNPYDWSERMSLTVSTKWDHLLYEGKYYSYYGIAPVLTTFLPYHLATGYYFPSSLACIIYSLIGAIFIGLCYLSIVKNWFKNTPFRLTLLGLVITLFSSSIYHNVVSTQFYEIAQSSALCFLVIGFYFMLNSGIFTKNNIRLSHLLLSSLFVSLSVLSRATCALYAIAMVFWIGYGLFEYIKEKGKSASTIINYSMCALLPYVIFGGIQMTYNYLRFENPLEFGIGYTLTIYDYTHIDMHLSLIMISIVNFLFAVPIINTTFPFIHGNFDNLNTNGYYFIATYTTLGVIPTTLPILSLLYSPKIAKNFNLKEKVKIFFIWFLPGIVFPIILVAMTWEYGYAIRYNADFAWQLSFAAFAVIYYVYNRLNNKPVKKWLYRVFFAATVWCVISNLSGIFSTDPIEHIYHNVSGAYDYYKIRNLFMFWN